MAHYAFLGINGKVTQVIVGKDSVEPAPEGVTWETYYGLVLSQACVQTSYNTSAGVHYTDGEPSEDQSKAFRYNYAGIGYSYDENRDAFIPPQPYASWVLDEDTCLWVAPIAYPAEGMHTWDEETGDWVEVTDETV